MVALIQSKNHATNKGKTAGMYQFDTHSTRIGLNLSIPCIPVTHSESIAMYFFQLKYLYLSYFISAQISPEKLQNWWIHLDPDQVPIVRFKTKKIIKGKKKYWGLSMQPQQRRKAKKRKNFQRYELDFNPTPVQGNNS